MGAMAVMLGLLVSGPAQAGSGPQAVSARVEAAGKLIREGNLAAGVTALEAVVATAPGSAEARLALGRALDLSGRHREARVHLEEAIRLAPEDGRNEALAATGISYAFESKPGEAARYYQRVFDAHMKVDDRASAAAAANALGRIYLESGDAAKAEEWYRTGHETAKQVPQQSASRLALWDMRWHHALGRIEARRGRKAAALEHASQVRALLDRGGNDNQRPIYPYLLGYIAFYAKEYQRAIDDLAKGDQQDVFVLGLIARAHEKLGRRDEAAAYHRKVLASTSHSINAAFARPAAQAFLGRPRRGR